ncbi:ferrous iron transport protein B [Tyzzerella sp. An114]|uniref:ferrous iron transport protein B n=1 Tax=Tyzzerella sp. An114 TaxID=1965545 RepID=UPI000B43780C|nr:ferrous iron transport protein B [Tyzzerella sp. An114]OUQ59517.1 ferrous iron transport protein B [Tyzzerella sp. An114]
MITAALAGNPNCGKTTLFNELTGAKQHVGNWPGVTVEKKEGRYKKNDNINILDLPGTYSLSPYSAEETIARDYIVNSKPDIVINIVDATSIERNLYLTMQIAQTGTPMVVALNMMDEVETMGIDINTSKLSEMLGVPVVPIVARSGKGIDRLMEVTRDTAEKSLAPIKHEIYDKIKKIEESKNDEEADIMAADMRYEYIDKVVDKSVFKPDKKNLTKSDKIDKIVTNRVLALPIFAVIMYLLFACTFSENFLFIEGLPSPGVWLAGVVETAWGAATEAVAGVLASAGVSEWLNQLVIDGIMGGIGAVFGFIPLVLVLFVLMSFLEDSGYMARVAFVMDRIFRKFGLSGKSFIPLLMGFGCSVPALTASRTLESEKDRKITMMVTPFMSCGAKLPIYLMFVATLFADSNRTLIIFSIYFLGMAIAIISSLILNKFMFKSENSGFIMELPKYRIPSLKSVAIHAWDKVKGFAIKAGTIILFSTILIWFLSNFNMSGMCDMEESFLATIGNAIAWIFTPLGFNDWRASVGVVTGWIAKENIVATFGQLFAGVTDETAIEAIMAGEQSLPEIGDVFTKVSAFSYMAFNLLCMPCFAAVGAMRREFGSMKWTLKAVAFQMVTAYVVALIINVVGNIIF